MSTVSVIPLLFISGLLEDGERALDAFRLDDAIAMLEAARAEGHHSYEEWVRIHEMLGIAYAYKQRDEDAVTTFERLLVLDPAHAIRYDLSPKATLPFEEARARAGRQEKLAIDVSWPRDASPGDALPIVLEVVSDPLHLLKRATIHHRRSGEPSYHRFELELAEAQRIVIPAPTDDPTADVIHEIFLVVRDAEGNEVLRWADQNRPREILLRYHPPELYERWWVWALAGAILFAGSAVTYGFARTPSSTFDLEAHR